MTQRTISESGFKPRSTPHKRLPELCSVPPRDNDNFIGNLSIQNTAVVACGAKDLVEDTRISIRGDTVQAMESRSDLYDRTTISKQAGMGEESKRISRRSSFELDDSYSGDYENDTDESFVEDDAFEILNAAVRKVFSSNVELGEKVIENLYRLPPNLRSLVYGFGRASLHHDIHSDSTYPANKRKRDDGRSSFAQDTTCGSSSHDNIDQNGPQVFSDDNHAAIKQNRKRFACGYNIFDRNKYCPQSGRGRIATRYKSCAGPGFLEINHYR